MKEYLKDEIYMVKPVEENVASWVEPGKDGHVRWEGTYVTYDVPLTTNGVLKILETEEQEFLENKIDATRPKGWLGPYVRAGNAWTGKNRYKITIGRDGIELNTKNAIDYIKLKILLANVEDIAPSYAQRLDKKYLFYVEAKSNSEKTVSDKVDKQLRAMGYIANIKDNSAKMRNLLLVLHTGKAGKVPIDISPERCRTMLAEYVEVRLDSFLSVIADEDLKHKVSYYKAIEKGAFEMINYELRAAYQNGKPIGNTIEDGIKYIKELAADTERQSEYAIFKTRIMK